AGFLNWPSGGYTAAAAGRVWTVEELTKELFERYVGEEFMAAVAGDDTGTGVSVRLAAVHEMPEAFRDDRSGRAVTDGFSAIFESDPDTMLGQGLYRLTNPNMGECTIFVVPVVSRDAAVRRYEAAFNRLV